MKNLACCIVIFFFTAFFQILIAQPDYIYEGGDGNGYSSGEYVIPTIYQFLGGNGIGYSSVDNLNISQYLFYGGQNNGYFSNEFLIDNPPFFLGGSNGGFVKVSSNDSQTVEVFEGGMNDGYVLFEKCEDFIWTGTVGTGWLVTGNWNYDIIPDIKRKVIIPAGVPAFPSLNAGVFAIGENPNGGAFECGQLWIQEGAYLETKINNLVENYSIIKIDGTMQVKNSALNAFQNFSGGIIRVTPTGLLLIQP